MQKASCNSIVIEVESSHTQQHSNPLVYSTVEIDTLTQDDPPMTVKQVNDNATQPTQQSSTSPDHSSADTKANDVNQTHQQDVHFAAAYAPWVIAMFAICLLLPFFYVIISLIKSQFQVGLFRTGLGHAILMVFLLSFFLPKKYTISSTQVRVVNLIGFCICRTDVTAIRSIRRAQGTCEHLSYNCRPGTLKFSMNPSGTVIIDRNHGCCRFILVSPCDPDNFVSTIQAMITIMQPKESA